MTDVLIRNVPQDDVRMLDHRAGRLGVSRTEYLRALLSSEARDESAHIRLDIAVRDFGIFTELPDADDEDFMRRGWSQEA